MAHESLIFRAKETLKLGHGGPSQRQTSVTNQPMKALVFNLKFQDFQLKFQVCLFESYQSFNSNFKLQFETWKFKV